MSISNNKSLVFLYFIVNLVVGKPEFRIKELTTEQRNNLNKICGGIDVTKKRTTGTSGQFKMFGNKAVPKEFPWSVRLHFYGTHPKTWAVDYQHPIGCSGVLITQQHLLTAAHCFFAYGRHSTLWNENPLVYVARVNMENAPQAHSEYVPNDIDKTYKIIGIKFHPCYKINQPINHDPNRIDSHFIYDIVIAQLDRALDQQLIEQELALPACLPTSRETGIGRDISFSGFGTNGSLEWSTMEKVGCDYRTAFLYPFILCYKPRGRLYHDDPGDSGGGLVQKGAEGQWHVIGVYSGLKGPWAMLFDGRGPGRTYSYIPVFYNLDWINKEVGIVLEKF